MYERRRRRRARRSHRGRWVIVLLLCVALAGFYLYRQEKLPPQVMSWASQLFTSLPQSEVQDTPVQEVSGGEPDLNKQQETSTDPESDPEPESGTSENWELTLVNDSHPLPEGWQVQTVQLANGELVDERILPALQQMFDDMRADGVYPVVASGYRTLEDQQRIYDEKMQELLQAGYTEADAKAETESWVAIPGTSEHQLGLAVDINADGIYSAGYDVYDWLAVHAQDYGFIQRYPEDKTEITGVSNEPWHYRYVGQEAAREMKAQNLCLEEYIAQHPELAS